MKSASYQANNIEFNPLYERMKERFCKNGTVAQQLLKRAGKKQKFCHHASADIMTRANSLPRGKASESKRSFFSLQNITTACMLLLISGTVLFSGAALGNFRSEQTAAHLLSEPELQDSMILSEATPWENVAPDGICEELSFSF